MRTTTTHHAPSALPFLLKPPPWCNLLPSTHTRHRHTILTIYHSSFLSRLYLHATSIPLRLIFRFFATHVTTSSALLTPSPVSPRVFASRLPPSLTTRFPHFISLHLPALIYPLPTTSLASDSHGRHIRTMTTTTHHAPSALPFLLKPPPWCNLLPSTHTRHRHTILTIYHSSFLSRLYLHATSIPLRLIFRFFATHVTTSSALLTPSPVSPRVFASRLPPSLTTRFPHFISLHLPALIYPLPTTSLASDSHGRHIHHLPPHTRPRYQFLHGLPSHLSRLFLPALLLLSWSVPLLYSSSPSPPEPAPLLYSSSSPPSPPEPANVLPHSQNFAAERFPFYNPTSFPRP